MNTIARMKFAALVAALVLALGMFAPVIAQDNFPSKRIRIISPYPPGGANDVVARVVADAAATAWGVPVVVENRSGGGGTIGTNYAATSPADGYTWLLGVPPNTINAALMPETVADPLQEFVAVAQVAFSINYFVVPKMSPVNSVREYVALAKSRPGKLNYGNAGIGSTSHMGFELLKHVAGISVEGIQYRGTPEILADLASGQLSATYLPSSLTIANRNSDKYKVLAAVSDARGKDFPELPSMAEEGYPEAAAVTAWYAVMVPMGTSSGIVQRIEAFVKSMVSSPVVVKRFEAIGVEATFRSSADTHRLVEAEVKRMRSLVKSAGIRKP